MRGENKALTDNLNYSLMCDVIGSRPEPVITWWKGSELMKNVASTVS